MVARFTPIVFAVSLFSSALLLFVLEPLITRLVLPLLGGSASVWNTALLFFQTTLLVGYLYAHVLTLAKPRWQLALHVLVLGAALFFLPPAIGPDRIPDPADQPVVWLLLALAASIGLPFLALAATAPLLQRWYSLGNYPGSKDPYFLYAASNIGSIAALLAYPTFIEPALGLQAQTRAWSVVFIGAAGLILVCGMLTIRGSPVQATASPPSMRGSVGWFLRGRWVAWSFVPSAMLLAVTLHISVNIASAPFLWVGPLALYLLSYVIAFARQTWIKPAHALTAHTLLTIAVAIYFSAPALWLVLGLHLGILFTTGLVCHQALAASRPPASGLTEFYFWNSLGGWLGGVFGALVAPLVFNTILEYPILLVAACFVRPRVTDDDTRRSRWLDVLLPVALGVYFLLPFWAPWANPIAVGAIGPLIYYTVLAVALYLFRPRPLRFGLAVGMVVLGAELMSFDDSDVLGRWRSFYGVYEVSDTTDGRVRLLKHGTTIHGAQARDVRFARLPLTYYNPEGPLGQVVTALSSSFHIENVAAVGLGVGTAACDFDGSERLTFFEIDPLVEQIAAERNLFSYLSLCGRTAKIEIQDGRLGLVSAPDGGFDLIVLDAFTSDAIPVHLLTSEALQTYVAKLTPRGVLLIHISNRYVELAPVLKAAADHLGLALLRNVYTPTPREHDRGGYDSDWVVIAASPANLTVIAARPGWQDIAPGAPATLWTDDYSNLFRALKWERLLWGGGG